jgi:dehydrogenase/reductase SDR family member 7B
MKRFVLSGVATGVGYWFWRYLSPQHSSLVLENQVVVVTGASSGLGAALATTFARRGARVVLSARRETALLDVEKRISPYATDTLIVPTDVTDHDQRRALVERVLEQFGQIDVLVNCAGVSGGDTFAETDATTNARILAVNLDAAVMLTHAVLPYMQRRNHGYIVNIGSISGFVPAPGYAAYSAAKGGLRAFSDALRRELHGRGVHILYAGPTWFRSEIFPPEAEALLRKFPQHSVLSAETVAEEIVEALVQGRREIVNASWLERFGVWAGRHFPRLHDVYWWLVTRYQPWYEMVRKTG